MKKGFLLAIILAMLFSPHHASSFEQGIGTIIKDALKVLSGRGTYGYWVGPGYSGGARGGEIGKFPPVDPLDAIAMKHDFAYILAERIGKAIGSDAGKAEEYRLKKLADQIAVAEAERLDPDPSKWRPKALNIKEATKARKTLMDLLSINSTKHNVLDKSKDMFVGFKIAIDLETAFASVDGVPLGLIFANSSFKAAMDKYFTNKELEKIRKSQGFSKSDLKRLTMVFWREWYEKHSVNSVYPKLTEIKITASDWTRYQNEFNSLFGKSGGSKIPPHAYDNFIRLRKMGASPKEARKIIELLRPGHYALDRLVARGLLRKILQRTPKNIIEKRRAHIRKRMAQLGHERLLKLLKYMGVRISSAEQTKFMTCLCVAARYGNMGTNQFYHPEALPPDSSPECRHPGQPCIVAGFGCSRHPLPGPDKTGKDGKTSGPWTTCLKTYKMNYKGKKLSFDELIEKHLRLDTF